jgi:hypothetical protein
MPQIGQLPGALRTISGCIGHTHSVRVAGSAGATGSKPMPHVGQAPGAAARTSGCIGQVYSPAFILYRLVVLVLVVAGGHA